MKLMIEQRQKLAIFALTWLILQAQSQLFSVYVTMVTIEHWNNYNYCVNVKPC